MAIDKHPQYMEVSPDWELMRDAYKGERRVKSKGITYLPMTIGQMMDGGMTDTQSIGYQSYLAYKKRARFPNFVREAVQTAIGMMHSQDPIIELPEVMKDIRSSRGETMKDLLRRINVEQLLTGRIGIMADLPTNPEPDKDLPYLTTYNAERILNWDDGTIEGSVPQILRMVALDESEFEINEGLSWQKKEKYRILLLNNGVYKQKKVEGGDLNKGESVVPSWKGTSLKEIPFVIINSADLISDVDDPPLLDLGNICMAIYRGEADYRQNLFMQGQDTFVTIGGGFSEDDELRMGAGARIDLPAGADAKYVGVQSSGLEEQRVAIENLERRGSSMGAQTLDTVSRERESGTSLKIRIAARTADMNQIVETGAGGLENILKMCAEWIGENPEEVKVIPNKDFGELPLTGQSMVEMATARSMGFPISARSLHELARKRNITTMSYEEEMEVAKEEDNDENNPFRKPENSDRAGPDQVKPGQDTDKMNPEDGVKPEK